MKYEIFYTDNCPYCERALSLLDEAKANYEKTYVSRDDAEMRSKLLERSNMRTFPQIFKDGELIGGYTELAKYADESGI
jgi:glutaredoxin 3